MDAYRGAPASPAAPPAHDPLFPIMRHSPLCFVRHAVEGSSPVFHRIGLCGGFDQLVYSGSAGSAGTATLYDVPLHPSLLRQRPAGCEAA